MTRQDFGRATEARFLLDAQRNGLLVSRPFDSAPGYDAVVDNGRRLFKVQIKGANPVTGAHARRSNKSIYRVNCWRLPRFRRPRFDVLAVYLEGEGRWSFLGPSVSRKRLIQIAPGGRYDRHGWEIFHRHR